MEQRREERGARSEEREIQRVTEYVEVPVSNSADAKAWRTAKRKFLDRFPHRAVNAVDFFRTVEELKELALSGDPTGTLHE